MGPLSGLGSGAGTSALEPRHLWVQAESILSISRVVSDLGRAESFYHSIGFQAVSRGAVDAELLVALGLAGALATEVRMSIGQEELRLVQFQSAGRAYPPGSRSDDLWFQHFAIVVADMDEAYARLISSEGWRPISSHGPETLPAASGGVRAFKFRDPDGHPLELLWLPAGGGRSVWHERARTRASAYPYLGIDHSALAVSSTRRSLGFYRTLGLHVCARSWNVGPAQSRLDGLPAARARVTGLRPASSGGPGLELLAYRPVGRVSPLISLNDLATDWITLGAVTAGSLSTAHDQTAARPGAPVSAAGHTALMDPDGHRFLLMRQSVESLARPA